ncbi:MAG: ADP-ribosylglycohydrolase family protein, partial [Candidatus Eisenbacteria bacterium]|nr:ADP-ribosylglycohydrolase family protein [Candidatus Eisenbacteria bacterium]
MTREWWLREELLASRLAPGEELPSAIRWIEIAEGMLPCGGRLLPGKVALDPAWIARLLRWRLAGLRPLVATVAMEPGSGAALDQAREAALEIDVLAGGTLDAIRILPPSPFPIEVAADATDATIAEACALPPGMRRAGTPGDRAVAERIRGGMLGLAVGDAIGAPVENWPAEKIARIHGAFRDYVSGRGWGPCLLYTSPSPRDSA